MKNKKLLTKSLSIMLAVFLVIGTIIIPKPVSASNKVYSDEQLLEMESRKSFEFFLKEANSDKNSKAYGLIRDRAPGDPEICSIASVGFGLTAYVIGTERGWITKDEARERVNGTLDTLINNADNVNGFFFHFLDMNTAKRTRNSEVSIIDTAIAVNGAITAGEYFKGEIKEKAEKLYKKVNWSWFRDAKRNQFYMGYSPEKGFAGWWDFYAEQLMLYVLGAASPTYAVDSNMFYSFIRHKGTYGNYEPFIHSWFGSIFTYQFSHAWLNLDNKIDKEGVNWWTNSVLASKSNRKYCIDMSKKFKTLGPNSWGLTASDGPDGYNGRYGAIPSGFNNDMNFTDGTVAPAGALGSMPFTPEESLGALHNYYENYPNLIGEYGLKDAYNLDKNWYDKDVIGIDKGITLLMIENHRSGLVWKNFMNNKYVQEGIKKVGLKSISDNKVYVSNVIVEGKPIVQKTLTASYSYFDADKIPEGNSSYQWLKSKKVDGEFKAIEGENSTKYTVKDEDVGYYLKFKVIPKTKANSEGKVEVGSPALSAPTKIVEVAYPVASNVTITKLPTYITTIINDFDENKIGSKWTDSGDKAYTFSFNKDVTKGLGCALKITYDKKMEWAYLYTAFEKPMDFSNMDTLNLKAYNNPKMIVKFENSKGQGIKEKWFEPSNKKDEWVKLSWDLKDIKNELKDVKRILMFVDPGVKDTKGDFYIDDFNVVERKIENVTTGGEVKAGEKLIGTYNYYHADGEKENGTTYRWLISSQKDREYTPIKGANKSTYVVRNQDVGKFIKFEVRVRTDVEPKEGLAVLSAATNKIVSNGENKPNKNESSSNKKDSNKKNNIKDNLPKTGSMVDTLTLTLCGVTMVGVGAYLSLRKNKIK